MKTFTNEAKLLESNNGEIVLTSHRIRHNSSNGGIKHLKSIMLENITSCEFKKSSNPLWIIGGAILIVAGFMMHNDNSNIIMGAGIVLAIVYLITMQKTVVVSSPSCKINFRAKEMSDETIRNFIDRVEEAMSTKKLIST
jgi:hypothetical protein